MKRSHRNSINFVACALIQVFFFSSIAVPIKYKYNKRQNVSNKEFNNMKKKRKSKKKNAHATCALKISKKVKEEVRDSASLSIN